jgi:hypothetical protein
MLNKKMLMNGDEVYETELTEFGGGSVRLKHGIEVGDLKTRI